MSPARSAGWGVQAVEGRVESDLGHLDTTLEVGSTACFPREVINEIDVSVQGRVPENSGRVLRWLALEG